MTRSIIRLAVSGTLVALATSASQAFPPFAKKEEKKCTYCHVGPSGGQRNYRGLYYKANSLSFAKFDDAAEAKKAGVEIGPDPEPKPKSWTAPEGTKPAEAPKPEPPKAPEAPAPNMAALKKKAMMTEAAYKKKPKDAKLKAAHAQALAELGTGMTLDMSVPPVKRYPAALKTLRSAKALDPKNKLALDGIKQIEDAYRALDKPIPK